MDPIRYIEDNKGNNFNLKYLLSLRKMAKIN